MNDLIISKYTKQYTSFAGLREKKFYKESQPKHAFYMALSSMRFYIESQITDKIIDLLLFSCFSLF